MELTRDEVETIFIHMNAFKEKLLNQGRLKEAWKYQDIVDKLDGLLTAESVIRCKDCIHYDDWDICDRLGEEMPVEADGFCKWAERKEE